MLIERIRKGKLGNSKKKKDGIGGGKTAISRLFCCFSFSEGKHFSPNHLVDHEFLAIWKPTSNQHR